MLKRMLVCMGLPAAAVLAAGCGLRWAPDEAEKQNAWLHHKTVQASALRAGQENTTEPLQQLTRQAVRQSEAILARTGLPVKLPDTETVEQLLNEENRRITDSAYTTAIQRPDPWKLADQTFEIGIGLAGLIGGAAGSRLLGNLKTAREKARALGEIIRGNEQFKADNPALSDDFKKAHQKQCQTTRRLVAELK